LTATARRRCWAWRRPGSGNGCCRGSARGQQVRRSRQFPFRFLSAYLNVPSLRWGYALEQALDAATANIPELPGRTLILIDTSASMGQPVSRKSAMTMVQAAALFGLATAIRNRDRADLYGFADGQFRVRRSEYRLSLL
jgi:hypothetical protein